METALATIVREPVEVTVAGRTDAGVHARGQVIHVDIPAEVWEKLPGRSDRTPAEALVARLEGVLRHQGVGEHHPHADLVIIRAAQVSPDFDARFSALSRVYSYRMAWRRENFDPMRRDVLWLDTPLDIAAMNAAAAPLIGEHEFLSYCKPREGATTIRRLLECTIVDDGAFATAYLEADAFCHSMVRTIMGTLMAVGTGKRPVEWPLQRLKEASRTGEVIVAPPHPLTLEAVKYPAEEEYGMQARRAKVLRTL